MEQKPIASAEVYFNPRSPHGERLNVARHTQKIIMISIHAPRTGSDGRYFCVFDSHVYFNPRSPHGERLFCGISPAQSQPFQSTLPARGATL